MSEAIKILRFIALLIIWTLLLIATFITLTLMISEITEAQQLVKIMNLTTPYMEKLVIIVHSTSHTLLALLYAVLLTLLVALDIVVAKEMFKE